MNTYPSGYYVYQYLRSKTTTNGGVGTPYYVGKGSGKRAYIDHGKYISVPKDTNNIVIISENMTEKDALQAEMLLIRQYGRVNLGTGILHNGTDGGDGGLCGAVIERTEEYKAKKSTWAQARFATPENNPMFNKNHTDETKKLQSQRIAERGGHHGENNPRFGAVVSDETRKKIAAKNKKYHWMSNDDLQISKLIHDDNAPDLLKEGWYPGIKYRKNRLPSMI